MNHIDKDSLAEIEFQLQWKSNEANHVDTSLQMINFWRDILPHPLHESLMGAATGDRQTFHFAPGQDRPEYNPQNRRQLKRGQFNDAATVPRYGRFYPRGLLKDVYNVFPQNTQPVRCVDIDPEKLTVDLNHPLSKYDLALTATVHNVYKKPFDRGGEIKDVIDTLSTGPGMQARVNGSPTDFMSPDALAR